MKWITKTCLVAAVVLQSVAPLFAQTFSQWWPQINDWMGKSATNLVSGGVVTNAPAGGLIQNLGGNSWRIYFPVGGVVTQVVTYVPPPKYLNVSGGLLTMSGDPTSGVNIVELIPATLTAAGFAANDGTPNQSWMIHKGANPIRLWADAEGFSIRNYAASEYRDLIVRNLTVFGTNNISNLNIVNIETNKIVLNSNITNGTPTMDAMFAVSRGSSPTSMVQWSEALDKWMFGTVGSMLTIDDITTNAVLGAWPEVADIGGAAKSSVSNQWPWVFTITASDIYNWRNYSPIETNTLATTNWTDMFYYPRNNPSNYGPAAANYLVVSNSATWASQTVSSVQSNTNSIRVASTNQAISNILARNYITGVTVTNTGDSAGVVSGSGTTFGIGTNLSGASGASYTRVTISTNYTSGGYAMTRPTSLANLIDDNYDTACGDLASTANQGSSVYWDLGAVKKGKVIISLGVWNAAGAGAGCYFQNALNATDSAIFTSPATYNGMNSVGLAAHHPDLLGGNATTAAAACRHSYVFLFHGQYVGFTIMSAYATYVRLYEFQVWEEN